MHLNRVMVLGERSGFCLFLKTSKLKAVDIAVVIL